MIDINSRNTRIWSRLGPSGGYGAAAMELGETMDNVSFMTADLCMFSGLERFKAKYPEKFYNFGIAEQNLVGAAGGMAKEGFIPFVSIYASFACSRCADQVRVNMAYMKLPIKLIGLTAGCGAGILGATHMSVEDVALMRALPNITILSPADCTEIIKCVLASAKTNNPTYIRLTGPVNTPIVYKEDYDFEIGKAIELASGDDVCIIATGSMVAESLKARDILISEGISATVINMHSIKPIDEESIVKAAERHKLVVTVEEHSVHGGLGSAVAEIITKRDIHIPMEILGMNDFFAPAGDYKYQLEQCGLTGEQIAKKVRKFAGGGRNLEDYAKRRLIISRVGVIPYAA